MKGIGPSPGGLERDCLGVVIHAFYPDLLADILDHLDDLPIRMHLYVTTPPKTEKAVADRLGLSSHPFTLMICENRGKDILPFVKIAPLLVENGHDSFLKVHTKKSPHRRYGFLWRNDIYHKLMTSKAMSNALAALGNDPGIGIIAPEEHLVPMTHYAKSIRSRIAQLAEQMGIPREVAFNLRFAAGSMFFARTDVILPILDLQLNDEDFEPENGQIDGTLAHTMERVFAVAAEAVSMKVVDTAFARRVAESQAGTQPKRTDQAAAVGRTVAN